jgi:hypothetical protein
MKCSDCRRPLIKPALTIGRSVFGPVCAKRYILRPTRTAFKVYDRRTVQREVDPAQMALELAA